MIRVILLLLACCLASCRALPGSGGPTPDLGGAWSITLTQSGGFAGVQRVVTVSADGRVVAHDVRADQSGSVQLSASELSTLAEQVAAAALLQPTRTDSGCADCFLYDVKIDSAAGSASFQLDDVTLPDSGVQPLVASLLALMDRALSTP